MSRKRIESRNCPTSASGRRFRLWWDSGKPAAETAEREADGDPGEDV
jgi:hypothetical protein